MVKLAGPEVENNYINANFIKVCRRTIKIPQAAEKIIATQGPLGSTVEQFWRMVDQHNVSVIFMLCQLEQKGKVQCFRYWPEECDPDQKKIAGDYEITLLEKLSIQKDLWRKKFKVRNTATDTQKYVTHYKFKSWPDHEAPNQKSYETIKRLQDAAMDMMKSNNRMVVHCSAGIGRTGTFIALLSLILEIDDIKTRNGTASTNISVFKTVRQLKEQRWGMVNRPEQYAYIYQFLRQYLENDLC